MMLLKLHWPAGRMTGLFWARLAAMALFSAVRLSNDPLQLPP
jgi:hypothetical protein